MKQILDRILGKNKKQNITHKWQYINKIESDDIVVTKSIEFRKCPVCGKIEEKLNYSEQDDLGSYWSMVKDGDKSCEIENAK